jgi:hypothetical protein
VPLKLDAAHTRHLDVRNHAREIINAIRPQELLGGSERIDNASERPHEAVGRCPDRFIIVNNCNKLRRQQSNLSSVRTLGAQNVTSIRPDCTTD